MVIWKSRVTSFLVDTVRNCGFSCLARVVISHEISFDNDYLFIIQLFAYYLMMPDFTWRTFPQLVIYFNRRKQLFSWAEFYQEFFKNALRILQPSAFSFSCENNCFFDRKSIKNSATICIIQSTFLKNSLDISTVGHRF